MSNTDLLGIYGYNKANGTEKLIAVWSRSPMIQNAGSWEMAPITLTPYQKTEFRTFLDYVFMVDGTDPNYSYDGTTWSTTTNLTDSPIGHYIENYNVRLYLLDVTILGTRYYSRVWFSDLPKNNKITWGLETGTNLVQTAASPTITSSGALFVTRNIKIGDPFTITTGTNLGEYTVQSIDSETQITLTKDLTYSTTGSSFWVGGNWFDVATDDGDSGKGFGKNSNEILVFKRNSLHRYSDNGNSIRQVKGAVGTTARRSIINIGDYTYYYHQTGIYRYGSGSSVLISNAIVDLIEGVTTANQTEIVAWVSKERIANFYLGTVTLRDGSTISNCVASFDTNASQWSTRSYPFAIAAATTWLESNVPNVYIGDTLGYVFKIDDGNDFNSSDIPLQVETHPYYPSPGKTVQFNRLTVEGENAHNVSISYKLIHKQVGMNHWINDSHWKPLKGQQSSQMSQWIFPAGCRAEGVAFKIMESSKISNFLIEKINIGWSNPLDL